MFVTVFYYLVYVQDSLDKAMLMVCIYFCATFLQIPYAMSPMLLWVPSLSRGGFRRVGSILIPWCLISVVVLVCLIVLKEGTIIDLSACVDLSSVSLFVRRYIEQTVVL